MNRRYPVILSLLVASGTALAQSDLMNRDTPVAPVQPVEQHGFTNVLRLRNSRLDVVIIPEVGRITDLIFKGRNNMLHLNADTLRRKAAGEPLSGWQNYGGDWFWPVAQERWTEVAGRNWPPPEFLADDTWQGHAWLGADGTQHALLQRTYGEPVFLKATRHFMLEPDRPVVTVKQSLERTAESKVPATLWNISQVRQVASAALPVDPDSRFPKGYGVLAFTEPPPELVTACDASVIVNVGAGTEHKLGSDSKRAWIAGERDGIVLLERARTEAAGTYPDQDSRVTLYSNTGLGYTEMETLSPEILLKPGERLENVLTMELFAVSDVKDCNLSDAVRMRIGEKAVTSSQPAH